MLRDYSRLLLRKRSPGRSAEQLPSTDLFPKPSVFCLNTDPSCEGACCVLRCWPHLDNHLTFIYSAYPIV